MSTSEVTQASPHGAMVSGGAEDTTGMPDMCDIPLTPFRSPGSVVSADATLRALAAAEFSVDESVGTEVVDRQFREIPAYPGVIVTRANQPIGTISRTVFYEWLSRPYGSPLYYRRPVGKLLRAIAIEPMMMEIDTPIAIAAARVLERPERFVYEPIVVTGSSGWRLLDIHSLLLTLSQIHSLVAEENQRMLSDARNQAETLSNALDHLRQTQDQLIEARKMASLGQLVAGVAHEINTPIGIGVTATSHLKQEADRFRDTLATGKIRRTDLGNFVSMVSEHAQIITINLDRAASLVSDFKAVSVAEAGGGYEVFDLKELLERIIASLAPTFKKSPHKCIFDCANTVQMQSYPGAVSQIVTNLVMNAMTHAFADGVAGAVSVTAEHLNGRVLICCQDNGKGIPEEHRAKVFEPFFTTRRGKGGTGLGLHIIYNLVTQKLGGTITMQTQCPGGTRFDINIPALRSEIRSVEGA